MGTGARDFDSFVIHQGAVAWIGKPDGAIFRVNDRIVGRIQRFAIELFSKGGDGAIVFVTNHFSGGMFAGNLPALIIESVAIRVTDGLAKNTYMIVFVEVTELTIIGDITPEEVVAYAIPGGAFSPKAASCKALDGGVTYFQFIEAFIE